MRLMCCLLKLSARKWAVIEASDGTTILNGIQVERCGTAKIIFGPTGDYGAATNFLAMQTRKKEGVA